MNEDKLSEELIKQAFSYADDITKPALKQVGGIIADKVTYWRFKNQVRIMLRAREYTNKKGISPRIIPLKTLGSLLNFSSIEEDETLQEMWARLLANATDPNNIYDNHFILVNLFKDLSTEEAKVLNLFWNRSQVFNNHRSFSSISIYFHAYPELENGLQNGIIYNEIINSEKEQIILENLLRLRIVEFEKSEIKPEKNYFGESQVQQYVIKDSDKIRLTALGKRLITECNKE